MARWRPFFQWVLAIPHFIVNYGLGIVRSVCTFIAFFAILFTKRIPDGLYGLLLLTYRYQTRAQVYAVAMKVRYPPFTFATTAADPGDDEIVVAFGEQPALNRWAPLYKWFLAIPLYLIGIAVAIVGFVMVVIAAFTVLFTGRYPEGPHRFLVQATRWGLQVSLYVFLLSDRYPPWWPGND